MADLITRRLGRTKRHVTTLGLGGQASLQWTAEGVDPIAIIEKAFHLGINYMDTSNVYGPSQKNFGQAFLRLGLTPGTNNYNPSAREKIYLASKTHIRSVKRPEGKRFPTDFSEGMMDGFNVSTSVDDVRRSLSLIFGDGKGEYPEGAYLDCLQFHNLNTMNEVDMLFEGFDDPGPDREWIGSLAAMMDLREGTNRTGFNPKNEKLIRHIGITGHWNTAALMYAIQRDTKRVLDTLLVTVNPGDCRFMPHRFNAIATAKAAGMGVIGMKVFADAACYHKDAKFSRTPEDVYYQVGSEALPSQDLIRYALSVDGVTTLIIGIGHIDDDPAKCQLEQNLAAAQIETPLTPEMMTDIETKLEVAGKETANSYFQRKAIGLTPARNVGAEADSSMPGLQRLAVRISWDTAYAGNAPIERYDVIRNEEVIGSVPHAPQISQQRFCFDDVLAKEDKAAPFKYSVRSVDASGKTADSPFMTVDPVVSL